MNFVYLMDPLHTVNIEHDTTFMLMVGAQARGHKVYFLPQGGMTRTNESTLFHVQEVKPQMVSDQPFIVGKSIVLTDANVHAVFIRTNPPFDQQYLMDTWLLDLVSERIAVINDPNGIRTANEKIWATQFVSFVPPTLIGRNQNDLLEFIYENVDVVAKPTDGFGGQSVFHVKKDDVNTHVILETLSDNYNKNIVLQKYIPEAVDGDKRILLLNGEPLGAVLRVHSKDDHRNNFFAGGKAIKTDINTRELKIIGQLKPKLKELGLYFVGVDVMGEYLIEVNVTSPTCLQEINRLNQTKLEDQVISFVEKLIDQKGSHAKISA